MMHIVVQVEKKMLPSSKSMMMLKKMRMRSSHTRITDQQEAPVQDSPPAAHSDGPAETMFLPLGTHQINMWCYCLMVQNLSAF
jgi:hypothetical protein